MINNLSGFGIYKKLYKFLEVLPFIIFLSILQTSIQINAQEYTGATQGSVVQLTPIDSNQSRDNIDILTNRLEDEVEFYKLSKLNYEDIKSKADDILSKIINNETKEFKSKNYVLEQYRLQLSKVNLQQQQLEAEHSTISQYIIAGNNSLNQLEVRLQALLGVTNASLLEKDFSLNSDLKSLNESINYHREILQINKKRLDTLAKHKVVLQDLSTILNRVVDNLTTIIEAHMKRHKIAWLSNQELKINQQINKLIKQELDAKKQINQLSSSKFNNESEHKNYSKALTLLLEAENKKGLLDIELSLLRINARISDISSIFDKNDTRELESNRYLLDKIQRLQKEAYAIKSLIDNKLNIVNDYVKVLDKENQTKELTAADYTYQMNILAEFSSSYSNKIKIINKIITQLTSYSDKLNDIYIKNISMRQSFPSSMGEWSNLIRDVVAIPFLLSKQLMGAWIQFKLYFDDNLLYKIIKIILIQFLILLIIYLFFRFVDALKAKYFIDDYEESLSSVQSDAHRDSSRDNSRDNSRDESKSSFSQTFFYIVASLLDNNKVVIAVIFNLYLLFLVTLIPTSLVKILLWGGLILLAIRFIIKICYIFLIENISEISGNDRRLYYGLKYSLIFGGLLSILMVFSQELLLPSNTQFFIDRLFMLFLLAVSYPLIINWQVVPQLIIEHLQPKAYVKKTIWLLGLIIPITILSNAAVGLVGYVNLAWKIAVFELQLSLVIALWLILKGLISEIMEMLSRFFIRNLNNGWLWTESVLKPLHTVINILLLLTAIITLAYIYGINRGLELNQIIDSILSFHLTNIYGVDFNLKSFIVFCIIFSILIWLTKWSREFSYRWVYSKTKDLGVRNSLAVLTQYSILIFGVFFILKILGFPMQALTVAIGGIVFFLGFGLRDIISNYISGIILLIERPIRVGDFITIGEHEGKVTKIGMRSLTVQSFDNMEVIVPNTDTITKSLTNWTFRDTIIRMESDLRVDYYEDLDNIRKLILDALQTNEDVLSNPESKVYFKEFSESAIIVKIYYYIDLNKTPSRGYVRTRVMLSLSAVFKQHHIKVAYPRHTISIDNNKDSLKDNNNNNLDE